MAGRLKKRTLYNNVDQSKRSRNRRQQTGLDEDAPLTDRAWLMLRHYVAMPTPNQFQAYRMAGYSGKGTSGYVSANQIFSAPNFQKALKMQLEDRKRLLQVEANLVLKNILTLSNANLLDYAEWTQRELKLKPSADLTRDQGYAVVMVEENKHRDGTSTVKIKLADKTPHLNMLATHLGLLDPSSGKGDTPKSLALQVKEEIDALANSVPITPSEAEEEEVTPSEADEPGGDD